MQTQTQFEYDMQFNRIDHGKSRKELTANSLRIITIFAIILSTIFLCFNIVCTNEIERNNKIYNSERLTLLKEIVDLQSDNFDYRIKDKTITRVQIDKRIRYLKILEDSINNLIKIEESK